MQISINPNSYFVFDLDDTLVYEIDFLESAFRSISAKLSYEIGGEIFDDMMLKFRSGENVFEWIVSTYSEKVPYLSVDWLLEEYHVHEPDLSAREDALRFILHLDALGIPMGILTDGQGKRQRTKLAAAGITRYFQDIIISEEFGSEKPDERNYLYFVARYPAMEFVMVGDNTNKDFIVPHKLGWTTICVKDCGKHIHTQSFRRNSLPDYIIGSFDELDLVFNKKPTAYQENFLT